MAHRFVRTIVRGMRRWPYWGLQESKNWDPYRVSQSLGPFWDKHPFAELERTLRRLPRLCDYPRFDYELDVRGPEVSEKGTMDIDKHSVTFNCPLRGFKPSHVKVKTVGRNVIVEAEREEKYEADGCNSVTHKRFTSSMTLPDDADLDNVTSSLSESGLLKITAPRLAVTSSESAQKETPIHVEKGDAKNNESEV